MGNDMNLNLKTQQMFNLIDKNKNGKIDEGDNLQLAQAFGLKAGDTKINEKKVNNFESKASIFSAYVNKSLNVQGSSGNIITQINGDDNNLTIQLPENKNETFNINSQGNFSEEAQFALMQKGLDPAAIKNAGFGEIEQVVGNDGTTQLILKSQDGYQLQINDMQGENVNIARDANNNLILDGVRGKLNVVASNVRSHEVILSNVYDDRGPTLEIVNSVPLTKTYIATEDGKLSPDARRAVALTGFPVSQLENGGFTQVSITDDGKGTSKMLELSSSKHGFVVKTSAHGQQPRDMSLNYNPVTHKMDITKLSNAEVHLNEDGAKEHNIEYAGLSHVHITNNTNKPCHITEGLIHTKDGWAHGTSPGFEYETNNNYDTWSRAKKPDEQTEMETITLHPGRYTTYKKIDNNNNQIVTKNSLHFLNRSNLSNVTMYDIIQEEISPEGHGHDDNLKMDRSREQVSSRVVYYKDGSLNVTNSNGNIITQINGNRNNVNIGPGQQLYDAFHIKADMFTKAGFNDISYACDESGKVTDIVFKNTEDGAVLTMPADKAMLLSEQMSITRNKDGEYILSNIVGKMEGTGMKIVADSNVSLDINELDPANGSFAYWKHDDVKGKDAFRVSYTVPDGMQANVYSINSAGELSPVKKPVPQGQNDQADPLNYSSINLLFMASGRKGVKSTFEVS